MKTLRHLWLVLLLPVPCALAVPLPAKSAISAVTVYADRAVVTRTASLELAAPGGVEVRFDKLPANLLDASLQVAGRGTAQATILDATARAAYVDFTPNERVKALEGELHALGKQQRILDDRTAVLKAQEGTLGRIEGAATSAPTKDSAPRLSLEESAKLLAFLEEQRAKLASERLSLEGQREALAAKVDSAQRALNDLRGAGGRSFKTVTVRLEADTAGTLTLSLSYAVPGASWTPAYDARVDSNTQTVALAYSGLVRQSTGEDWTEVALTLSTARPSLGGSAPVLSPWLLDVFAPQPVPMPTAAPRREKMNFMALAAESTPASGAGAPGPAEQDAAFATAAIDRAVTSASFQVAAPSTVPSDNSPQKVPITTARLAARLEYVATPKLLPAAFLTAKVSNRTEFPLLAGAMNVFLDGTFVATSRLRTVMAGEKFDLALGVDEGIAVQHKRVQRFTEETGLTGHGQRVTYEYLITLQNHKPTAVQVSVADTLPVSRNEKIVVRQLAPEPRELKAAADGALKWNFELKPAEKRELPLKFSVDYPGEVPVAGLEP